MKCWGRDDPGVSGEIQGGGWNARIGADGKTRIWGWWCRRGGVAGGEVKRHSEPEVAVAAAAAACGGGGNLGTGSREGCT